MLDEIVAATSSIRDDIVDAVAEELLKAAAAQLARDDKRPVTVEETIEYCRNTLDIMMPGGGYCFSPTHCLQDNSPTENVLAMYETARGHGRY